MAQFSYKGTDIDVDHNGIFIARIDGAGITGATLAEVKQGIDAEIKANIKNITIALPVTGIASDGVRSNNVSRIAHGTITGINRTNGGLVISGVEQDWRWVLPDNELTRELCAEFVEVLNRYSALDRRVRTLQVRSPASGRVAADEYAVLIKELAKRYNAVTAPPVRT